MSTPSGPEPRSTSGRASTPNRLNRVQQLTLNVWRLASSQVSREVCPSDVLAQVAIHTVLAILRDTEDPLTLFARHDARAAEFALVASLAGQDRTREALHDLLDTAFLLRWVELTGGGRGPEELPPLSARPCGPSPFLD